MTTTKLYSGLADAERNSSRVLAPPGGKSSNIFGGGDDVPVLKPGMRQQQASTNVLGQGPVSNPAPAQVQSPPAQQSPARAQPPPAQATPPASEPAQKTKEQYNPITGALVTNTTCTNEYDTKQNNNKQRGGAYNPITGEAYKGKDNTVPSTRVRNPPGGKSSGPLW